MTVSPLTWEEIGSKPAPPDVVGSAERLIQRFCILPHATYLPLALWAVAAHTPDAFDAFPYIALLSPVKGCGKTRVLEVLHLLVPRSERLISASPASIFRLMADCPTLLLDEVEALRSKKPSESAQMILSILNAGHRKGGTVPRCQLVKNGDSQKWEVVKFPVHGFKAFAAIGQLPETLADRCIVLSMQRQKRNEHVERFRFSRPPKEAEPVRRAITEWARDNHEAIQGTYEQWSDLPFLSDRDVDIWLPLFSVCAVAVPERIEELKRCAIALSGAKAGDDVDDSLPLRLLADVRSLWVDGSPHILTASLIAALEELPDSPWAEPEYKLTPRKLAGTLRPFGIVSRDVRIGTEVKKGYRRADFDSGFSSYLPS